MTHMDHVATIYDTTIAAHVQAHYLAKRVAFIRCHVPLGTLVDIGCGTGRLATALRDTGYHMISVDPSVGMVQQLRRAREIPVFCGDGAQLALRTHSVDSACSVAVLHHMTRPGAVPALIRELVRVVRPGGRIVLWDHNPLNPYWPFFMRRLPQDQEPTHLVPLGELRHAFAAAGVRDLRTWRLGLVPDFAPRPLLRLFQCIEWMVERLPVVRCWCAHNVVLARTPIEATT